MLHTHNVVQRIQNSGGPTPPPLSPLDQLKQDLSPSTQWQAQSVKVKSGGLLHLPERLMNLEHCMDLYSGMFIHTVIYKCRLKFTEKLCFTVSSLCLKAEPLPKT